MPCGSWLEVEVKKEGYVWMGDSVFPEDGVIEDAITGITYTLRETESIGKHFIAYVDGDYIYTMRCNTPGTYFLGDEYGYRKIPAESETCPVRRVLRKWGLPIGLVEVSNPLRGKSAVVVIRETAAPDVPPGTRYLYCETDGEREIMCTKFGMRTSLVSNFSYVLCVKEESEQVTESATEVFNWISKIHLNTHSSDEEKLHVADMVDSIMNTNKKNKEPCSGQQTRKSN